ncbi:MAG: alpha-galactosidase [Bacteroidetes bacterium]|nr:alpha-galactosidase [Bacteroidota bacterium]MBU1117064.1 alpha-galactosidase [Bacteroidota bacterium]MBU1797659.1 alpha-galactosidase [Bacteroidota bacterium]
MNKILLVLSSIIMLYGCQKKNFTEISSDKIKIEYDNQLHSKVISLIDTSVLMTDYSTSEFIIIENEVLSDFNYANSEIIKTDSSNILRISGICNSPKYRIQKTVHSEILDDYPQFILTKVYYKNLSTKKIAIDEWVNNNYNFVANRKTEIPFWSYQSGSYSERPDWVLPINEGFSQENFMGMNTSDYGGGTPVIDVWRNDVGLAVGHVELYPKLVSLPVIMQSKSIVNISINQKKKIIIEPQKSFETYLTFIEVHKGDYYSTLSNYSLLMQKRGIKFDEVPEESYDPIWCAWGYERNFDVEDILNTLPKVKELGFKWAVLDDGWQTAEGDWYLDPKKFPNGDSDMIAFVDKIHDMGLKAKLWWAPLAVDPGTDLYNQHSDMILLNKLGKPQDITWWDSFYLCPAYKPTLAYTKKIVEKIIGEWGFDGLKIDGQHLNSAPPCYNPEHNHKYPEESVEAMPNFYKAIYEATLNIKKNAVVEICPCGTAYSYYMLPYLNQPVSSDPTSSWQIRLKGKTFKALMGRQAPYYGDHVELSDNKNDYASTIGVGGIIGTKFTWPVGVHINKETGDVSLTPKKEKEWKTWMSIYNSNKLPKGNYLGELYDIGYDKPETHVIEKGGVLFYALYADKFSGKIELRGLDESSKYEIIDYVNNIVLGVVEGSTPKLQVSFNKYLLIKAVQKGI